MTEIERALEIAAAIARIFGRTPDEMIGRDRHKKISWPRHLVLFFVYRHTRLSYPDIAELFGGRDHSTIISSCQKVIVWRRLKPEFARMYKRAYDACWRVRRELPPRDEICHKLRLRAVEAVFEVAFDVPKTLIPGRITSAGLCRVRYIFALFAFVHAGVTKVGLTAYFGRSHNAVRVLVSKGRTSLKSYKKLHIRYKIAMEMYPKKIRELRNALDV